MRHWYVHQHTHLAPRLLFHASLHDRYDLAHLPSEEPLAFRAAADLLHALGCLPDGLRRWPWDPHGRRGGTRGADLGCPLLRDRVQLILGSLTVFAKEIFPLSGRCHHDHDASHVLLQPCRMALWNRISIRSWLPDVRSLHLLPVDHLRHVSDRRAKRAGLPERGRPCASSLHGPFRIVHQNREDSPGDEQE